LSRDVLKKVFGFFEGATAGRGCGRQVFSRVFGYLSEKGGRHKEGEFAVFPARMCPRKG
jgi:hypothetical protein